MARSRIVSAMPLDLIEFPADDLARARRFWETLLEVSLDERSEGEGQGLQTHDDRPSLGLHDRGRGPGDRARARTRGGTPPPRRVDRDGAWSREGAGAPCALVLRAHAHARESVGPPPPSTQ